MQTHNNSRKANYEHIFNELDEYMFSTKNMFKYFPSRKESVQTESKKAKKTQENPADISYIPHHKDKLFWSFYILLHGFDKYEFVKNDGFKTEKMFKIATIEKLRGMKDVLKEAKLKRNEIEDELVNQQKITLNGLHALCLVYGVSVTYVFNRKYCEFLCGDTAQGVILGSDKGEDGVKYESDEACMTHIRNNYWKITDPKTPLKAFSNYTLKELQEICSRLEVNFSDSAGKKKSKKGLYESILNKL
jgi:hypothetical protein